MTGPEIIQILVATEKSFVKIRAPFPWNPGKIREEPRLGELNSDADH